MWAQRMLIGAAALALSSGAAMADCIVKGGTENCGVGSPLYTVDLTNGQVLATLSRISATPEFLAGHTIIVPKGWGIVHPTGESTVYFEPPASQEMVTTRGEAVDPSKTSYCTAGVLQWAEKGTICHSDPAARLQATCGEQDAQNLPVAGTGCVIPKGFVDAFRASPTAIRLGTEQTGVVQIVTQIE